MTYDSEQLNNSVNSKHLTGSVELLMTESVYCCRVFAQNVLKVRGHYVSSIKVDRHLVSSGVSSVF